MTNQKIMCPFIIIFYQFQSKMKINLISSIPNTILEHTKTYKLETHVINLNHTIGCGFELTKALPVE